MTDIVERLRRIADASRREDGSNIPLGEHCREAIAEIERLRDVNEELQGIDATLGLALERAQRERDEAIARAKELKRDLIKARGLVISEGVRLLALAEKAERERDEARAALAPKMDWADRQDDHTLAIIAAWRAGKTLPFYAQASEMVGNRHSKGALIHLTAWLLARAAKAGRERDEARADMAKLRAALEWLMEPGSPFGESATVAALPPPEGKP